MCSKKYFLIILWTILTSSRAVDSILNSRPPNVLVFAGQPVTFPLTFSSCNWERLLNGDLTPIYTSSDKTPTNSRYSINQANPGQCDLTITNVSFSDAGIYQYANGEQYGLELFVIDQNPLCFVPLEGTQPIPATHGDNITLGCSLSYSNKDRKLFPTLEWQPMLTISDKSMYSGEEKTVQHSDYNTITSVFSVPYNTPIEHVSCFARLAKIPTSSSDNKMAQNAITYSGYCGQIEIPAKNIKITGDVNMRLGDKFVCSAQGNPEVTYYWMKDGFRAGETSSIILDSKWLHMYKCCAYNVIQGHNHTVSVEKTIFVYPDEEVIDNRTIDIRDDKEIIDNTARVLFGSLLAINIMIAGITFTLLYFLWLKAGGDNRLCCCNTPGRTDVKPADLDANERSRRTDVESTLLNHDDSEQPKRTDVKYTVINHDENDTVPYPNESLRTKNENDIVTDSTETRSPEKKIVTQDKVEIMYVPENIEDSNNLEKYASMNNKAKRPISFATNSISSISGNSTYESFQLDL